MTKLLKGISDRAYSLKDIIQVNKVAAKDKGWPEPSPFNLKFKKKKFSEDIKNSITGPGIYLISDQNQEVIYIGLYRKLTGDIISDRWARHLQTITGRGVNIGLGGKNNPEKRASAFISAIQSPELKRAIKYSYTFSRDIRFKDTGVCTSPNRLRYASENWEHFRSHDGEAILGNLKIWLLKIRTPESQVAAKQAVESIEKAVRSEYFAVCNSDYNHERHAQFRFRNTVRAVISSVDKNCQAITNYPVQTYVELYG